MSTSNGSHTFTEICVEHLEQNTVYERDCYCPPPCKEDKYHYTISTSEWPSVKYEVSHL